MTTDQQSPFDPVAYAGKGASLPVAYRVLVGTRLLTKAEADDLIADCVVQLYGPALLEECERLKAEASDFHEKYRRKCDEETKQQAQRIAELDALAKEYFDKLNEWQAHAMRLEAALNVAREALKLIDGRAMDKAVDPFALSESVRAVAVIDEAMQGEKK